jgi:hypothetical protein
VNKKKQKNFIRFGAQLFHHRAKRSKKVFWFFFSKKNFFPFAARGTSLSRYIPPV